jgi:hypothetical protein
MRFGARSAQAIVQALIATAVLGGLAAVVPQITGTINKQRRLVQVRNILVQVERRFRIDLSDPEAYEPCAIGPGCMASIKIKAPVLARLAAVRRAVLGAQCAPPDPTACGVRVVSISSPSGTPPSVTVQLDYEGREVKVQDSTFTIFTPTSLDTGTCPAPLDPARPALTGPDKPLFLGVDPVDGKIRCGPLPADCPAGQVAVGWETGTAKPVCRPLRNQLVPCPGTSLATAYTWDVPADATQPIGLFLQCPKDRNDYDPWNYAH